MTDPLYIAHSIVEKVHGTHRKARMEIGKHEVDVEFGVHGAIRQHFRLLDEKDLPLPVDYIVAATGA